MFRMPLAIGLAACLYPLPAQTPAPNAAGVAMGHLHLNVRDMDAHKRFWTALGGTPAKLGTIEGVRFPGVVVYFKKVDPTAGTEGCVIGHLGFVVKDLAATVARLQEAGFRAERAPGQSARQTFATAPDAIRVEISEDPALATPVAHHDIQFYPANVETARGWYVKHFGAVPGRRGRFEAADIPGANLTFSEATGPAAPTRGRAVDHIGFQVRDLEAFARKLEADGVKLDTPYRKVPSLGIALVFVTDPYGTYVELTEPISIVPQGVH